MKTTTPRDVLLYYPNIIGYGRVVATLSSFYCMLFQEDRIILALALYIGSFVGDLFDGIMARKFDQCSQFGGMLDMITDRCSTAGFLVILATKTQDKYLQAVFTYLLVLDVSSHWAQMVMGYTLNQHHKSGSANAERFFLVRWFYGCYPFFGYLCVGAEFTYIIMYPILVSDMNFHGADMLYFIMYIMLPACLMKQIVNVAQLCSACYAIAEQDAYKKNKS